MSASNRDNTSLLIQPSVARGDSTSMWHRNEGSAGGIFTFNITAQGTTLALPTFTVQGRVGDTTRAYNVARLASTTPTGVAIIIIYPGLSTAAAGFRSTSAGVVASTGPTEVVAIPLPYQFRVRSTNASTATVTWQGWVDLLS